jgi:hypothetical protein
VVAAHRNHTEHEAGDVKILFHGKYPCLYATLSRLQDYGKRGISQPDLALK